MLKNNNIIFTFIYLSRMIENFRVFDYQKLIKNLKGTL